MPQDETQQESITDRVLYATFEKLTEMEQFDNATITRLREICAEEIMPRPASVKQALAPTGGGDETA